MRENLLDFVVPKITILQKYLLNIALEKSRNLSFLIYYIIYLRIDKNFKNFIIFWRKWVFNG